MPIDKLGEEFYTKWDPENITNNVIQNTAKK